MKIKRVRKKPKAWLYPSAIEREYVKFLLSVAEKITDEVAKKLPEIQPHFERHLKQDGLSDILSQWLEELLETVLDFVSNDRIKATVQRLLNEVQRFNKNQFHKVLKSAYGVNIFVTEPFLMDELALFELENLRLIKSLPTQYVEQLRGKFTEAVRKGRRWEDVAKEMQRDLPEKLHNRARLIARDQIGKLNGQLTKLRQQNIGVTHYIWRGMLDERERQLHVDREGERFAWDNPPEDGHPGEAILCRCYAEAVFPDAEKLAEQKNVLGSDGEMKYNPIAPNYVNMPKNKNAGKNMRSAWDKDFPDTVIDRKLGEATSHPLYTSAKSGNIDDAYHLANNLVTDEAINKLSKILDGREAILVPVHAEEAVGRNMIPLAVAGVISKRLKLPIDLSIVQATKVSRTGGDGWHRLAHPPMFDGEFPAGKLAIIIDDTQTQGGTLASLKGYIENNSGKVIGSYALTGKQYSVQLRLSDETLKKLRMDYGSIENWWTEHFGYDFSKLTEWEARFILNSRKTPDEVRNTILAR